MSIPFYQTTFEDVQVNFIYVQFSQQTYPRQKKGKKPEKDINILIVKCWKIYHGREHASLSVSVLITLMGNSSAVLKNVVFTP